MGRPPGVRATWVIVGQSQERGFMEKGPQTTGSSPGLVCAAIRSPHARGRGSGFSPSLHGSPGSKPDTAPAPRPLTCQQRLQPPRAGVTRARGGRSRQTPHNRHPAHLVLFLRERRKKGHFESLRERTIRRPDHRGEGTRAGLPVIHPACHPPCLSRAAWQPVAATARHSPVSAPPGACDQVPERAGLLEGVGVGGLLHHPVPPAEHRAVLLLPQEVVEAHLGHAEESGCNAAEGTCVGRLPGPCAGPRGATWRAAAFPRPGQVRSSCRGRRPTPEDEPRRGPGDSPLPPPPASSARRPSRTSTRLMLRWLRSLGSRSRPTALCMQLRSRLPLSRAGACHDTAKLL